MISGETKGDIEVSRRNTLEFMQGTEGGFAVSCAGYKCHLYRDFFGGAGSFISRGRPLHQLLLYYYRTIPYHTRRLSKQIFGIPSHTQSPFRASNGNNGRKF